MAKRQIHDDLEPLSKRRHNTHTTFLLLDLADDCVKIIFTLLEIPDIKSLSLSNSAYRKICVPYMFRRIRTTWENLISPEKVPYLQLVLEINIINHWEYGEWNVDLFGKLEKFPNICLVKINSIGSCGWLRYRLSPLNLLSLYPDTSDSGCERRLDCVEPSNPTVRGLRLDIFNGFPNLHSLHLNKYRFLWTDQLLCAPLRKLYLLDCQWNYPFVLNNFNQLNLLELLSLEYSSRNNFLLSDCFKRFVLNIDSTGLKSLRVLHIDIDADTNPHSLGKSPLLSKTILSGFLSKDKYPCLYRLSLNGWAINLHQLPLFFEDHPETNVKCLELEFTDVGRKLLIPEISTIRMEAMKMMQGVKIRLGVREKRGDSI